MIVMPSRPAISREAFSRADATPARCWTRDSIATKIAAATAATPKAAMIWAEDQPLSCPSATRPVRRTGRDRERGGVLDRVRGQPRRAGNIKLVLILNCVPVTWPAALVLACTMPRKEPR